MPGSDVFAKLDSAINVPPAVERDPNTFTTKEYAIHAGLGKNAATARLDALWEKGLVERVKLAFVDKSGRTQKVFGWRYVGNQPAQRDRAVGDRNQEIGNDSVRAGEGGGGGSEGKAVVVAGVATSNGGSGRKAVVRGAGGGATRCHLPRPQIPDAT